MATIDIIAFHIYIDGIDVLPLDTIYFEDALNSGIKNKLIRLLTLTNNHETRRYISLRF